MKKRIVVLSILLLVTVLPVFGDEYANNRFAAGIALAGEMYSSPDASGIEETSEPHVFYAPNFTYERVFDKRSYGRASWEINTCVNPLEDICSLSFAMKFYISLMEDTTGCLIGFYPLADFNVYNLFKAPTYMYYGIGCMLGGYFIMNHNFDFEAKINLNIGVFDTPVVGKMSVCFNLGYWF